MTTGFNGFTMLRVSLQRLRRSDGTTVRHSLRQRPDTLFLHDDFYGGTMARRRHDTLYGAALVTTARLFDGDTTNLITADTPAAVQEADWEADERGSDGMRLSAWRTWSTGMFAQSPLHSELTHIHSFGRRVGGDRMVSFCWHSGDGWQVCSPKAPRLPIAFPTDIHLQL